MENTIRIKTFFSKEVSYVDTHNLSIVNPFIAITTPFMPTMISLSAIFIINGLKENEKYFAFVSLTRCDSNDIIFESKEYPITSVNKINTILNFALNNVEINQTESGDYKAVITIFDQNKNKLKTDGDTFKLVKVEE